MEIVFQTIRIIDYENNVVYVRDTPDWMKLSSAIQCKNA